MPSGPPTGAPAPVRPLIGVNYTHVAFDGCSFSDNGILFAGQAGSIGATAVRQLTEMRVRGVESVRLLIWHTSKIGPNDWGMIPSEGRTISEPYRTNLIYYLSTVRALRFARLTISFAPQWTNSPLRLKYDRRTFGENWRFIRTVRALAEHYGPADVRFDLLNEGAPSDFLPARIREQVSSYIAQMYRRYAATYGTADVVVSFIGPRNPAEARGHRLENLVHILRSTGVGLPRWFDLHLNYPPHQIRFGLRRTDRTLARLGLTQGLVIGETAYDDGGAAAAFRDFANSSTRPLEEIVEWYGHPGNECPVSPPYSVTRYRRVFAWAN